MARKADFAADIIQKRRDGRRWDMLAPFAGKLLGYSLLFYFVAAVILPTLAYFVFTVLVP